MTSKQLKGARVKEGFSMQDMADCLGIPKSTYARYEDGSALLPGATALAVKLLVKKNKDFFAGMDARIVEHLPGGMCPNEARI